MSDTALERSIRYDRHWPSRTKRHCHRCYGMRWRVEGVRCACGLVRGPDVYQVQLRPAVSNLARALWMAWEGEA